MIDYSIGNIATKRKQRVDKIIEILLTNANKIYDARPYHYYYDKDRILRYSDEGGNEKVLSIIANKILDDIEKQ